MENKQTNKKGNNKILLGDDKVEMGVLHRKYAIVSFANCCNPGIRRSVAISLQLP